MFTTKTLSYWHYKAWQRLTAGYLRTFYKNNLPNNELIGYVINDKHPKTIRVACDRYMYVVRYKKTFRMTKKVWAHDENSQASLGDIVRIQPLGYRLGPWKTYTLVKLLHQECNKLQLDQNPGSNLENSNLLDTKISNDVNL